jgi:DNA polymerase
MPKTQKQPTVSEPINEIRNMADVMRPINSVVPPIAPIQTISVDTAKSMASRPTDLNTLNRLIGEFNHPLRSGVTNVVPPHSAPEPNGLLIITDMPAADDDASGTILSGAAGELMDKMLAAISMSRNNVSIMPMLFWRTPGGRSPSATELEMARPFVNKALELLKPRIILTLGTLPAMELASINLAKSHGSVNELPSGAKLVPIYHPNYLLLKPAAKRDVWTALQNIEKMLKSPEI